MAEAGLLASFGTFLVGGLTLVSVLAVLLAVRPRRATLAERLATHAQVTSDADAVLERPFWDRAVGPFLHSILAALGRLSPKGGVERERKAVLLAGSPGGLSVLDFLGIRLLMAVAGLAVALFLASRWTVLGVREIVILVAIPVLGYVLPGLWLRARIRRRQEEIRRALPDALDMLTICVESGLGLEAAMLRLGDQWDTVLSREMRRTVREMRMGVSRAEALRHLVQRTEVSDLAGFVAVIVQSEQLGVSIADVLRTQSDQMRVVRWQRAEERARGAPFKMVFALTFFTFPALFIVILGPAVPRFQGFVTGMTR